MPEIAQPEALHVVCPHCQTTNRVRQEDLARAPDCGKCHRALFERKPTQLDEASFERLMARSELPVLVDFWAPWCGPCRMMAPAFEQAAAQLEPRVRLAKLNTEEAASIAARLNIRSIPTLALFIQGREVARQAGATDAGGIVRWANAALQRSSR